MEESPEPPESFPLPQTPSDIDQLIRAFTEKFRRKPNAEEAAIFDFMRDLLARKCKTSSDSG